MKHPLTKGRARRIRLGIRAAHTWANLVERRQYAEADKLENAYAATPFTATREAFLRTQQTQIRKSFRARREALRNTLIQNDSTHLGGTP